MSFTSRFLYFIILSLCISIIYFSETTDIFFNNAILADILLKHALSEGESNFITTVTMLVMITAVHLPLFLSIKNGRKYFYGFLMSFSFFGIVIIPLAFLVLVIVSTFFLRPDYSLNQNAMYGMIALITTTAIIAGYIFNVKLRSSFFKVKYQASTPLPAECMSEMSQKLQKIRFYMKSFVVLVSLINLFTYLLYPAGLMVVLGISLASLVLLVGFGQLAHIQEFYNSKHTNAHQKTQMIAAISSLKPEFIFYFSGPTTSTLYHVTMWLPYLEKIERPFFIMVREDMHVESLKEKTSLPIVSCVKLGDIPAFIPPSVKAVFYANNGTKNTHMARQHDLSHIQLLHGDSDKPASFNPISQMYDKLFVAGQLAIDRYKNNNITIEKSRFEIVGRPQIDDIQKGELPKQGSPLNLLYLPTWEGFHDDARFSSLQVAEQIIQYFISHKIPVAITFKPHPLTDLNDPATKKRMEAIQSLLSKPVRHHKERHRFIAPTTPCSLIDLQNNSDFMLTDISSVMVDYLASRKPYIVSNTDETDVQLMAQYPTVRGGYALHRDINNLDEIFQRILVGDDKRQMREEIARYALGDFDVTATEQFIQTSIDIIDRHRT